MVNAGMDFIGYQYQPVYHDTEVNQLMINLKITVRILP